MSESKEVVVAEWCASPCPDAREDGEPWLLDTTSGLCGR
jgi:hypothetical protein